MCYYIASLPVDAEDLPGWSARPPGCEERPAPHLGRAVPGGQLSPASAHLEQGVDPAWSDDDGTALVQLKIK